MEGEVFYGKLQSIGFNDLLIKDVLLDIPIRFPLYIYIYIYSLDSLHSW